MRVWVVWHSAKISRIEAVFSSYEAAQKYIEHLSNVHDYHCRVEELTLQENASRLIESEYAET